MPRLITLALVLATTASAQTLHFDASAPIPAPTTPSYHLGSATNPAGHTLGLNSRYLTLDNQPILPTMGELHFSRVPADQWDDRILKMKSAGIDILSTYIFWIHHEEIEGQFDWSGQRDLRRFIQACAAHHMYVIIRVGPWAHGEARNGGLPDWLLAKPLKTRHNDPEYLKYVDRFYTQIAAQVQGQLWKDGGPIIGVQIENEYSQGGSDGGVNHLRALKELALKHGLDVPFYTVTGWDRAAKDPTNFLSVFGGYPDAPWDAGLKDMPPQEVYAFRFNSRVSGNMGAIGASGAASTETASYDFPFITAEMGGGIEDTYHRRPVIAPDDIAAMMPIMLGSGVNLYGSYMFSGGINPEGKLTTLQESLATKYPNDLPLKSYDFQAPLGEFGDERPVLRKLKVFDYFLQDFGPLLAPMPALAPSALPTSPHDLAPTRAALRTDGHSGFLFLSNYVRGANMPARPKLQAVIKLKDTELKIPETPITLPANTYTLWPFNLTLGPKETGIHLYYATAELFAKATTTLGTSIYFIATPGIPANFVIQSDPSLIATSKTKPSPDGFLRLTNVEPSLHAFLTGKQVSLYLITQQQAEDLWRVEAPDGQHLLLTTSEFLGEAGHVTLRSDGDPHITYLLTPPLAPTVTNIPPTSFNFPPQNPQLKITPTKPAGEAPPVQSVTQGTTRPRTIAAMPSDDTLKTAAATWNLSIPQSAFTGVHTLLLDLHYTGDLARISTANHLLDDNLYNGLPWRIDLNYFRSSLTAPLQLSILPLRADAPIFLEKPFRPTNPQTLNLTSIKLIPQYQADFNLKP